MKTMIILKRGIDFEISSSILATFFLLLLTCPLVGQAQQKKPLTENDYGKWGTLWVKDLSDQGKWASYEMTYENHNDTLFLQRTSGNGRYSFPKGRDSRFGGEKIFTFLQPESKLKVIHLETLKTEVLTAVKRYELMLDGKYIITLDSGYGEKGTLKVRNQKGIAIDSIVGVTEYALNDNKDALCMPPNIKSTMKLGL